MKVEEIMTTKLETIAADDSVYEAIEKMVDKRLRSLLVKPKDDKDVHGVITVRDIVFKVIGKNLDPKEVKVHQISSKPVVCIDKAMDVQHAMNLMQNFNIARVFICERMDIGGVVSLMDIMAATLIERARGVSGA